MSDMDEKKLKAAEIFMSDRDVFVLGWNRQEGWSVADDGCADLQKEPLCREGIDGLASIVKAEEMDLCRGYLEKIHQRMAQETEKEAGISERRINVELKLHNISGEWEFYSVECYAEWDAASAGNQLAVFIRRMDSVEVYRLLLAREITNDKNPEFFTREAMRLMDRYPDRDFALIQFDVEKFKVLNEQYGEETGDALLDFFVEKMKLVCREDQLYVRLSADVFMMITAYDTKQDIRDLIEKIDKELLGYQGIAYRLVYGVCYIKNKKDTLRKYGDGAAFARQSVKGNALEHVGFYQADMRKHASDIKFVEDNMEKALKERQFEMYLQPKYSISGNRMVGAEALARWNHPTLGLVSPACFIPVFEENGFVIRLDAFIWEEACRTISRWIDSGMEPVPISVNVSRRHLQNSAFIGMLEDLIEKYHIPKEYLEIEITETIQEDKAVERIETLREHGFKLLMDDFGSGYSSLNMLKDTPFDVIKIDRGFLQNFISSGRGQEIVRYTIRMTRAIGLDMVAEGVETEEQARFLSECGCDIAQGFYYAKPMPVAQFDKMIKKSKKL